MGYYLLDHGQHTPWYPERRRCQHGVPPDRLPHLIVIHTSEQLPDYDPPDETGESLARWAATQDRVSWHTTVDSDSIIPMLPVDHTAWHVAGYNRCSVGIEFATEADLWADAPDDWVQSIIAVGARVVARWAAAYSIPLRRLTRAEVDAGQSGLVGHAALDPERRTDPGEDFPWSALLDAAQSSEEDDMVYIRIPDRSTAIYAVVGGHLSHIPSGEVYEALGEPDYQDVAPDHPLAQLPVLPTEAGGDDVPQHSHDVLVPSQTITTSGP